VTFPRTRESRVFYFSDIVFSTTPASPGFPLKTCGKDNEVRKILYRLSFPRTRESRECMDNFLLPFKFIFIILILSTALFSKKSAQKTPAAENFIEMSKNSLKGKNSPDSDYYIFFKRESGSNSLPFRAFVFQHFFNGNFQMPAKYFCHIPLYLYTNFLFYPCFFFAVAALVARYNFVVNPSAPGFPLKT